MAFGGEFKLFFLKKRLIEKNNNTSRVRHEKNKTPHKKGETMAAE